MSGALSIGFINSNGDAIAHVNNLRERAFGVSPKNRLALNATSGGTQNYVLQALYKAIET